NNGRKLGTGLTRFAAYDPERTLILGCRASYGLPRPGRKGGGGVIRWRAAKGRRLFMSGVATDSCGRLQVCRAMCPKPGHQLLHSITLSAFMSSVGGISRPSVCRLKRSGDVRLVWQFI